MKNHLLTLLLGLFLYSPQLLAQKTGSFTEAITFNDEARTLNCYVPNDYDASRQYGLMIALHGLGDNSGNYSSAIISSLNWGNAFENTIIICPDGGSDASKDFYAPEGDEGIIEEAIQFATDNYSIDDGEILLQGFSLGGRSALKYGLDNPDRFKGLILNTPAIQGVADLNNDPNVPLASGFAFDQASKLPVYIIVGRQDFTYIGIVQELEKVLVKNDAILQTDYIGGMGHTLTGVTKTKLAADFIANSSPNALDVELSFMETDIQYCDGEAAPTCILRNLGSTEVTSIDLDYSLNGNKASFNWTGSLAPFQHAAVELPAVKGNAGIQEFSVSLMAVNGSEKDDDEGNNELVQDISIAMGGMSLPYTESFEQDAWKVEEKGNLFTWYHEPEIGHKGSGSLNAMNNILYFYTDGYTEHTYTPVLDLSSIELPSMAFDVSYNYVRYTPPYFIEQTDFADTLIISISTDCGATFTELFKKGGADLATFDLPMTNPASLEQGVFSPTEGDWDRIVVELDDYKNATEAVIRFSYRSGMGGCIYIDNARFDKALSSPELPEAVASLNMYPNPAKDQLTLSTQLEGSQELRIYDLTGKVMEYRTLRGTTTIDVSRFPNGYYQVELRNARGYIREALIIAH